MKTPIIVIADDLTGAAEIAGIGLRYGLSTRLALDPARLEFPTQLTAINADTRALPVAEARRIIEQLVRSIPEGAILFKKVDSVLRGHVVPETESALDSSPRFDRALLLSQNPSRGRVVKPDGTYLVEGVPLAQTTFADDPDYPTRTSRVLERIGKSNRTIVFCQTPCVLSAETITVGAADALETIDAWIEHITESTLIVGAADLFSALMRSAGFSPKQMPAFSYTGNGRLFVSGSTASTSRRALRAYAARRGVEVIDADPKAAAESIRRHGVAIVMSPEPGGVEADPLEIEEALAGCAKRVIEQGACDWIFAEGGATATAICKAMNWNALDVEAEIAAGVVVLKPAESLRLTIKPGSYAWPTSLLSDDPQ